MFDFINLHWIDASIILAYFAFVTCMGFYFARKNSNTEEYFVGGRSISGWVIGLSLVGTSISSVTFIAYPGDAFKTTWLRYIPNFALPLAAIFALYVFIPFFRRNKVISTYEYLERRFGSGIRTYSAIAYLFGQFVRLSIVLYLLALLMHEMTGANIYYCVVIAGLFVGLYTIFGGIDAVIWTDVSQTIILFLGGFVCLVLILTKLPGGLSQVLDVAVSDHKLGFGHMVGNHIEPIKYGINFTEKTFTMMLLLGFLSWLGAYTSDQCTVQRYCASKSTREARKAVVVCVFSSLPIWAFYMFLGTALYVFFKQFPTEETMQMLNGEQKAEQVLPFFIINYTPIGFKGFVIASALAAAMSSLDSSINAISTIGIIDIYKRHFVKNKSDIHYLWGARIIATFATIVMIIGAIILINAANTTVRDMMMVVTSVLGTGLLGIYLLGFFTTQGDSRTVGVGIISSVIFSVWMVISKRGLLPEYITIPFDLYYTSIFGNLFTFLVGYFGSALFQGRSKRNLGGLTVWTAKQTSHMNKPERV